MRRLLKPFAAQTPGEKLGFLDGTNLFFGALLGANLGTIDDLPLHGYTFLVVVLAGTVITLRQFSTSERRGYAYGLLALYVGLIALAFYGPARSLEALSAQDRNRLAITLLVWLGSVLIAELMPTRTAAAEPTS